MMTFDETFAEEIVASALKHPDIMREAATMLGASHFTSRELAWVFKIAKETWDEHRELPTPALFVSRARREMPDEDTHSTYLALTLKLYRQEPLAISTAIDELRRFNLSVKFSSAVKAGLEFYKTGDIDEALKPLKELVGETAKHEQCEVCDWMEEFPQRMERRRYERDNPEKHARIMTNLPRLDRVLGGLGPRELGAIMGTTGRGKSIFATHLGFSAIWSGKRVLHLSLEMSSSLVATRYDSRWTGYLHKELKRCDLTEEDEEQLASVYERDKRRFFKRLRIVSTPIRGCDISLVQGIIDDFIRDFGGIDLLIFDSPDHMRSGSGYRELRQQQAASYWDVKNLIDNLGIPCWVTMQAGRQAVRGTATTEDVAESYDKSRILDVVLSLNAPKSHGRSVEIEGEEDAFEHTTPNLVLYLAKNRDGEGFVEVPLIADFSRMLIREVEDIESDARL